MAKLLNLPGNFVPEDLKLLSYEQKFPCNYITIFGNASARRVARRDVSRCLALTYARAINPHCAVWFRGKHDWRVVYYSEN